MKRDRQTEDTHSHMKRDRQTDRHTLTHKQTDRRHTLPHEDRQTDRQTDRHTLTHEERQTDRQTHTHSAGSLALPLFQSFPLFPPLFSTHDCGCHAKSICHCTCCTHLPIKLPLVLSALFFVVLRSACLGF